MASLQHLIPTHRIRLLSWDLAISFVWAWWGALSKIAVNSVGLLGHRTAGEVLKGCLYVCSLFLLALMGRLTNGGSGNPITVLAKSASQDLGGLAYTVLARIPIQVLGSILGATSVTLILPPMAYGAPLNARVHHAALIEGLLAFVIVLISLALTKYDTKNFFMRTWIHSVSRLALRILGSDISGGIMNPAAASGWAFALRHHSLEGHVFVYWVAPLGATLLAVWVFDQLVSQPMKRKKTPRFMTTVPRRLDSSSRILSRRTAKLD